MTYKGWYANKINSASGRCTYKKGKIGSKKRNKSLSKLVSEYFKILTSEEDLKEENLTPNVKLLYGALADKKIDKSDYIEYLEKKHS